ncbi:MAG: hypothetical protein ABI239_09800 [Aquihabitans sp.]
MRLTRLVIESGKDSVSLDLHPRLTVIAGVDDKVRSELCEALIGALGSQRSGVRLEVTEDSGRQLAVDRPANGSHRMVAMADSSDVSEEFRSPDSRIDLLAHHGIARDRATDLLHLDREKLHTDQHGDERVTRLADIDQRLLWSAAARVQITDEELRELNVDIDSANEDAEIVSVVEKRHQTVEAATQELIRLRRRAATVALFSLAAALPLWYFDPSKALPVLAIGVITILLTLVYRARVEAAHMAERKALAQAGADSYLSFVVQRVDGMFSGTEQRKRLTAVADDHRTAAVRWTQIAGDVSVEWSIAHHDEIQATARLKDELRSLGNVSTSASEVSEETAELARSLIAHMTRLRAIGRAGESMPLIIDDPFLGIPSETRAALLELVARSAGSPQLVLLTDQTDVADWARVEALTGEVALVEPMADGDSKILAV